MSIPAIYAREVGRDFLDDVEDSEPTERRKKVVAAMERVLGDQGYIEAPSMAEAVAAAAVVAASDDPESAAGEPYLPPWLDREPIEVDERLEELATQTLTGRCATTTTSGGSCGRRPTPPTR